MANIANSAGGVRDRCAEQREAGGRAGGSGEGGGRLWLPMCAWTAHTRMGRRGTPRLREVALIAAG